MAFIGIPWDDATSYRPGARFGPMAVREGSRRLEPYNRHFRAKPFEALEVVDWGDVDICPGYIDDTYRIIEGALRDVAGQGVYPLVSGGDHSISLPILRALAKDHGRLALVHFDAHDDCEGYPMLDHGTPFAQAVKEDLVIPERSIHVGLRGSILDAAHERDIADMGYHVLPCDDIAAMGVEEALKTILGIVRAPSYVTFDIDAVDPAFAPGTGTPEVGGLTSREALALVRGLRGIGSVGFDLVEVAPPYDPAGITAMLASNLMYEFLSLLATERPRRRSPHGPTTTSLGRVSPDVRPDRSPSSVSRPSAP